MGVVFEEGYHALYEYMTSLSEEEFFTKKTESILYGRWPYTNTMVS